MRVGPGHAAQWLGAASEEDTLAPNGAHRAIYSSVCV